MPVAVDTGVKSPCDWQWITAVSVREGRGKTGVEGNNLFIFPNLSDMTHLSECQIKQIIVLFMWCGGKLLNTQWKTHGTFLYVTEWHFFFLVSGRREIYRGKESGSVGSGWRERETGQPARRMPRVRCANAGQWSCKKPNSEQTDRLPPPCTLILDFTLTHTCFGRSQVFSLGQLTHTM